MTPREEQSNTTALDAGLRMEMPFPRPLVEKSCLTKQRYVELVQLGKTASEELIKHGLQRHEYCEFGQIMQKIMQLE